MKTPAIDARTPMARATSGKDQTESRVGADRIESRHSENDRRDQGDLVALEEVGRHPGAVADIVADVVGDGGRVAGIVFGDALFDLSHQVGADIGCLGEDAATHPKEQSEQRTPEAEPDQDGRRGVLKHHDDQGRAEQSQADGEHSGHATGPEGHLQSGRERTRLGGCGGADIAPDCQTHADEAGKPGQETTRRRKADRSEQIPTRTKESATLAVGGENLGRGEIDDHHERDQNDQDRPELPAEVGHGAFLNGGGDLLHLLGALIGAEDAPGQQESDTERDQRRQQPR